MLFRAPHLKLIVEGYYLRQISEDSDAVPGAVSRDEAKEQKEHFAAPAPVTDCHFLVCPVLSSSAMQHLPRICWYIQDVHCQHDTFSGTCGELQNLGKTSDNAPKPAQPVLSDCCNLLRHSHRLAKAAPISWQRQPHDNPQDKSGSQRLIDRGAAPHAFVPRQQLQARRLWVWRLANLLQRIPALHRFGTVPDPAACIRETSARASQTSQRQHIRHCGLSAPQHRRCSPARPAPSKD